MRAVGDARPYNVVAAVLLKKLSMREPGGVDKAFFRQSYADSAHFALCAADNYPRLG